MRSACSLETDASPAAQPLRSRQATSSWLMRLESRLKALRWHRRAVSTTCCAMRMVAEGVLLSPTLSLQRCVSLSSAERGRRPTLSPRRIYTIRRMFGWPFCRVCWTPMGDRWYRLAGPVVFTIARPPCACGTMSSSWCVRLEGLSTPGSGPPRGAHRGGRAGEKCATSQIHTSWTSVCPSPSSPSACLGSLRDIGRSVVDILRDTLRGSRAWENMSLYVYVSTPLTHCT